MRVLQVRGDEPIADHRYAIECLHRLGDDLLPVRRLRPAGVDGNQPAAGRINVGLEPEDRAVVVEERVFVVEVVDQLDEGRVGRAQGLVEDAVLVVRPLRHGDDQVRAVVGDAAVELPFLLVGTLVDEVVFLLGCPERVEVELVIIVGPLQVLAGLRLGEAAVVEAASVPGPRSARELDPAQQVVAIAARGDVADPPLLPVGARRGQAVGEERTVVAHRTPRQGDGPIGGERVGVEQDSRLGIGCGGRVEDALVLKPAVPCVEVAPTLLKGDAELLVVPELGKTLLDRTASRDRFEKSGRDPVLGFDPVAGRRRVRVLERPVRVGDPGTMVVVDGVGSRRLGIARFA